MNKRFKHTLKKITSLLLICLFFLIFSLLVHAQKGSKPDLFISGQKINPDFYFIEGKEVLISARTFSQTLDTKVRWFGPIKTLQIEKNGLKIKMMVDSQLVQVGKNVEKLSVAPRIVDNQMYVPLIFLSSYLDYLYSFSEEKIRVFKPSISIEGFSVLDEGREFRLDLNKKPKMNSFYMEDPARVVFDIYDALLKKNPGSFSFEQGPVKEIRFSQFKKDTVRVVFELRTPGKNYIEKEIRLSGYSLKLTFPPVIKGIDWQEGGLVIKATDRIENYSVNYLEHPNRMVIDLPDVIINNSGEIKGEGPVKSIRSSQFSREPCVARIVLDMDKKIPFKVDELKQGTGLFFTPQLTEASLKKVEAFKSSSGDGFKVYLDHEVTPQFYILQNPSRLVMDLPGTKNIFTRQEVPVNQGLIKKIRVSQFDSETTRVVADLKYPVGYRWEYLNSGKNQIQVNFQNEITALSLQEKDNQIRFRVNFTGYTRYSIERLTSPDRLVIDMSGMKVNDNLNIPQKTNFIQDIRVSQFSKNPRVARVVLELPFYPGHDVYYNQQENYLDLVITTSRLDGRLIVLDPGHGGVDAGAIGSSGLLEKDVNLEVARELKKLLENAGARVLMTRNSDNYPSFPHRVGLANNKNADIFVSIHCNSYTKDIPEGTETYIAAGSYGKTNILAELVQSELVRELRLLDRGVKPANFYVLINTKMPAILVELAFISNPREEELLSKKDFRNRAARAIYRGINRYFSRLQ